MEIREENMRAAKLALARKKLKDHQEKKLVLNQKIDTVESFLPQEIFPVENNNVDSEFPERLDNSTGEITKSDVSTTNLQKGDKDMDINVTEILISNKRNLESHISELESKLNQLKSLHSIEINDHNFTKQQLNQLQSELNHTNEKYAVTTQEIFLLEKKIEELTEIKTSISDENNNLTEQLEDTKTILTSKEMENASLRSHIMKLQNEFDVTKLQLQQLNSGSSNCITNNVVSSEEHESLLLKINNLEQQLTVAQKEKEQINIHYENYVTELNEQLKSVVLKNDELSKKVQGLTIREHNLIEQISDMEIRLQNFQVKKEEVAENHANHLEQVLSVDEKEILDKYTKTQEKLQDATKKIMELEQLYAKSDSKVVELQEIINSNNTHENISISKLTADIASDKVAAQRATEQNKKLKSSMQELEEAFVKMSQDKLELTEKLAAEKYLNRELTIKLAEIEERSKDMHTKLMAKDEEMIRLQMTYRDLERDIDQLSAQATTKMSDNPSKKENNEETIEEAQALLTDDKEYPCTQVIDNESTNYNVKLDHKENTTIPQEDAMLKLQERFMKIMGEVADLSDEKHRLEHIILQLQNETDTICEYVALYQQQRSLLKKRDEERSAQIKLFQVECERLKSQLEELSGLLLRFAEDRDLATYFQVESRQKDMDKVRSLLLNLKKNTLVDPKSSLELSNIYPCNCCSGNLIDV